MRVALAVHGLPPELNGGTERGALAQAQALVRAGHEVLVIAGTLRRGDPPASTRSRELEPRTGRPFTVVRVERPDLYFDHWQKGTSVVVGRVFEKLLSEFQPDVLHLQHWLRLSDDLVRRAARAGVPAVVTLHDHHATCLLTWRVEPRSARPCEARFDALGCAQCAGRVPPRTPWVELDQKVVRAVARQDALESELRAARAVLVPSQSHGEALLRLGLQQRTLLVLPPFGAPDLTPRPPLDEPVAVGALRVGAWGLSSPAKGARLVREAVAAVKAPLPVELHLAGADAGEPAPGVHTHGVYDAADLGTHPVTDVHLAVIASAAAESYSLVAEEAQALGLPLALPLIGSLADRFVEGDGVWFYPAGRADELARLIDRAARDPEALAACRARVTPPARDAEGELEFLIDLYQRVVRAGPGPAAAAEWYEERLAEAETEAWDEALSRTPPEALGLHEAGEDENGQQDG